MLSNLFTFVKAKGSSLPLPAHGWVGARATSSLAAHFAKQNTNSVGVQSEGEAEGGCGGNSASPEPKRSVKILRSDFRGKKFGFRSAFGAIFDKANSLSSPKGKFSSMVVGTPRKRCMGL